MPTDSLSLFVPAGVAFALLALSASSAQAATEAVISVKEQRVVVLQDGGLVAKFPVSTSKFGIGDSHRSYCTPLGKMKVCEKIGGELASGTVIKGRRATGEVLPANAPGRDPIVTRILWLDGCESQNANAKGRGIYIHGTTEESRIGKPASYGCIRMRSKDVIALYEALPVGATVTVVPESLPHFPKYVAPPPVVPAAEQSPSLLAKLKPAATTPPPIAAHTAVAAVQAPMGGHAAIGAVAAAKRTPVQTIATVDATLPKPAVTPRVSTKPAIAQAAIRTTSQFAAATSSVATTGGHTDFTQAMHTSILHAGLQDRSGNSEIPTLDR